MTLPRRSARLSAHLNQEHQQRAVTNSRDPYSQSQHSSTSTTSQSSPVNDGTNPPPPTPYQPTTRLQVHPDFTSQQNHLNVPLPSPSAGEPDPFFGRAQTQLNPYTSHPSYQAMQGVQTNSMGQEQGQSSQQQQIQQPHHPHQNSVSQQHPPQIQIHNPGQLPPNFLAEAAKRAQMACLMRDLGDVSL